MATPTLSAFTDFVFNTMGVPSSALSSGSPAISTAFSVALQIVYTPLSQFAGPSVTPPGIGISLYELAVYNLAGSNLINFTQDATNAPVYKDDMPYFEYYRQKWNLLGPISGVVSSAADESTSTSLQVPEQLKYLTLSDLQLTKDPWGRQYLNIMSRTGFLVGMS